MKRLGISCIIFAVVAILIAGVGIFRVEKFNKDSTPIRGIVLDKWVNESKDVKGMVKRTYNMRVTYTVNGISYTPVLSVLHKVYQDCTIDTPVLIYYSVADPNIVSMSETRSTFIFVLMIVVSIVLIIYGASCWERSDSEVE